MRLSLIIFLLFGISVYASRQNDLLEIYSALKNELKISGQDIDTVVKYKNYDLHVIIKKNNVQHMGVNLFSDSMKKSYDKEIMDYIEFSLLSKILGIEISGNNDLKVSHGSLNDFKDINPMTPCVISDTYSNNLLIEWELPGNQSLQLEVPISYENIKGGSRGEIENQFIDKLRNSASSRRQTIELDIDKMIPYGKELYVVPGESYINPEISRNVYFLFREEFSPVWDCQYPLESMSNFFILSSDIEKSTDLSLTFIKHDYGKNENLSTCMENFMAVCENDGCVPFWGVESFDGQKLVGSLFMVNRNHEYNHIIKIECEPYKVIEGKGRVMARVNLFVPTNNTKSIFE